MDYKKICLELAKAESENDVDMILSSYPEFSEENNWEYFGRVPNNIGLVNAQQSDPIGALVEKIVNSIDAVLTKECIKQGIDPKSSKAPQSMFEASKNLFGIENGDLPKLSQSRKRELAENIQIVASGSKSNPAFAIIDMGEGQHPENFPNTFLSILSDNKDEIPFVQGRFNMGGTGVLPFCGQKGYQLIISRRNSELIKTNEENLWGFTLVRLHDIRPGERSPKYEYFICEGKIPAFRCDSLPLLPINKKPRGGEFDSGTYIKLYDFNLPTRSMVTADLYRRLNLKLFYLPLPVKLFEGRNYLMHTRYSILEGMRARLEDRTFREEVLETPDFPIDWEDVKIADGSYVKIKVWLFKSSVDISKWLQASEAICITINGQTHDNLSRSFFKGPNIKKDFLKDYLLVEVDCSNLNENLIYRMFMSSRDRMRDCEEKKNLINQLQYLIKNDEILKTYNLLRKEEKLKDILQEAEDLDSIFRDLMKASDEIKKLLGKNGTLPDPSKMGQRSHGDFKGERYPTFLELLTPKSGEMELPINRYRKIEMKTDAENEYFTRINDPGKLIINPKKWVKSRSLRNGRLTILVEAPDNTKVGDKVKLQIKLTTPNVIEGLNQSVIINIVHEREPQKNPPGHPTSEISGLKVPKIEPVSKSQWDIYNWDEYSVSEVNSTDEQTFIFVNIDNINLQRTLRLRENINNEDSIEKIYLIGIGILSLALYQNADNSANEDNQKETLRTLSEFWLPIALNLPSVIEL